MIFDDLAFGARAAASRSCVSSRTSTVSPVAASPAYRVAGDVDVLRRDRRPARCRRAGRIRSPPACGERRRSRGSRPPEASCGAAAGGPTRWFGAVGELARRLTSCLIDPLQLAASLLRRARAAWRSPAALTGLIAGLVDELQQVVARASCSCGTRAALPSPAFGTRSACCTSATLAFEQLAAQRWRDSWSRGCRRWGRRASAARTSGSWRRGCPGGAGPRLPASSAAWDCRTRTGRGG